MKFILSVTAALVFSTAAFSQHSNHSAFGIKGGVNAYSLHTDEDDEFDTRIGFHGGFIGHFHLSKNFALQPELVYSSQGAQIQTGGTQNNTKVKLNYINVPLLAQYMLNNGLRFQAGPQFGYLLSARSKVGSVATDLKDSYQAFDFSAAVGVSYVHPPSGVGIDARFNFGLNSIAEDDDAQLQNRGAQIGFFYLFNKKKS